jgi:hypothetical protein
VTAATWPLILSKAASVPFSGYAINMVDNILADVNNLLTTGIVKIR